MLHNVSNSSSSIQDSRSKMKSLLFVMAVVFFARVEMAENRIKIEAEPTPCTCGIFLSGQFKKGSKEQPRGIPVLTQEMDNHFPNTAHGNRQCTNRCLESIIKHLPKSGDIICATADRDCYKERAYLFIKNYGVSWTNTNMSAGREFCCKDNAPYKCPHS